MEKKELRIIGLLTIVPAFMEISALPCALFVNVTVLKIAPVYWSLMANFLLMGALAFFTLKYLCPHWRLGLHKKRLACEASAIRRAEAAGGCRQRHHVLYLAKGRLTRSPPLQRFLLRVLFTTSALPFSKNCSCAACYFN